MQRNSSPRGSSILMPTVGLGMLVCIISLKLSAFLFKFYASLAVLSFSAGARVCMGSRFAMTESVCMLALLVRQYEILVPSDIEPLPWVEQKEALLKWTSGVTLKPVGSRVRLRRRS